MSEFERENSNNPEEQHDANTQQNAVNSEVDAQAENTAGQTAEAEQTEAVEEQNEAVNNTDEDSHEVCEQTADGEHKCCGCCGGEHDNAEQSHECCGNCKDKKKGMKKGLLIGLCAAIVLAVIAFFSYDSILLKVNPTEYMLKANMNTIKQMAANLPEWAKSFAKSAQDGSINLKIDTTALSETSDEDSNLSDLSFSFDAEYTANAANNSSAFSVDVAADGVNFDISLVNDGNTLSVASDKFTDGTAYGFARDTFEQKFANSVFAPGSGSDFSMDEQSYELILNMVKNSDSKFDFVEYIKKSTEITRKSFKNLTPEVSTENIDVNGKDIKAVAIKYTLNEEQVKEFMDYAFDAVKEMGMMGLYSDEQFEQLKQTSSAVYKDMEVTYYIKGGYIIKTSMDATMNGQAAGADDMEFTAEVVYGLNPFKDGEIGFSYQVDDLYPDSATSMTMTYSSENEDGKYIGNLIYSIEPDPMTEGLTTQTLVKFVFDRASGEFSATVSSDYGAASGVQPLPADLTSDVNPVDLTSGVDISDDTAVVISGKLEKTDVGYTLAITNITEAQGDKKSYPINISISSDSANEVDAPSSVSNILDMSEEQIYSVVYGILYKFYSIESAV